MGLNSAEYRSSEAVKTWTEGEERRFDTFTIAEFDDFADADELEAELGTLHKEVGLEAAMELAEDMATANRYLDPLRDDPRVFFQEDAPPDPFTTSRQRELILPDVTEMDTEPLDPITDSMATWMARADAEREAHAELEGEAWFEATFNRPERQLLQPLDDTVNYAVVVQEVDPWTSELAVEKYWKLPDGYLGIDELTLKTFDSDNETARAIAESGRLGLVETYDERGLEGMMHQAELAAMQGGWLDGNRLDTRLFRQGPPDRFDTLAQQLEGEINPYWNTESEKIEDPTSQLAVENPYWRLDPISVNDLDGEPLGHALHMVVYPGVEHDPDTVGSPAMAADEPFRMLEMAHFDTIEAVDKFGKDFNGYLIPGLLDGPELATEVARLEGLPAEWKMLEGDDLKAYQNAELTLTREPADWHLYNPNAERDARIAAEGLYTDPIQRVVERDEGEIASGTPELDF